MDSDVDGTHSPEALDLKLFNDSNLLNPIPKEFISWKIQELGNNVGHNVQDKQLSVGSESSVTLVELEECFSKLKVSTDKVERTVESQSNSGGFRVGTHTSQFVPFVGSQIPVFSRGWDKLKGYIFSGLKNTTKIQTIPRKTYTKSVHHKPQFKGNIHTNSNPSGHAYARVPVHDTSPTPDDPPDEASRLKRSNSLPRKAHLPGTSNQARQTSQQRVYARPSSNRFLTPHTPSPSPAYSRIPLPPTSKQNKNSCPPPLQSLTRSKKYIKTMISSENPTNPSYIKI